MTFISLTPLDLVLAGLLVLALALLSFRMQLGLSKQIIIAALRTTIQLLLVGLVLRALFANVQLPWVVLIG
ncbi:ABC transporter permease, partial [candidate division KSB1 bacterium]|nr:ABC transporter permease [candidate division KSB1 bacterium]NIR71983.1 ABC transporter permease [candidate division KSB1 bacterium]NIS24975.1 ABC transporter permease [candidate division KSB1 bacterium]NIT72592.1 ABC transporter permease [candidate division KSB1 bacterium]NIU25630.1 ABC transporter permease [candidate division KSB1 bacterium]